MPTILSVPARWPGQRRDLLGKVPIQEPFGYWDPGWTCGVESSWTKGVWGQDCRRACSIATQRGLGGKLPLWFASISCHLSRPLSITAELICYLCHLPCWASPCAVHLYLGRTVPSSLCRWYVTGKKEGGSESEEAQSPPLLPICDLEEGSMLSIARN